MAKYGMPRRLLAPFKALTSWAHPAAAAVPSGDLSTVRGIAFSIRHSSTLRMTHYRDFLAARSLSLGRSTCAW